MGTQSRSGNDSLRVRVTGVIVAGCLAMVGFSSRAVCGAEGANLAPNPGFESTNFPGTDYLVQSKDHLRRVADQPYEGKYCVRQDAVPWFDSNNLQMYEAMIPVKTGQIYRLAVQSRNTLRGADALFGFREANGVTAQQDAYPGGDTIIYTFRHIPAGRSIWERYELILRPNNKAKFLQVYFCVPPSVESGSVWWDAVSVTEEPEPIEDKTDAGGPLVVYPLPSLVLDQTGFGTKPERLPLWVHASGCAVGGMLSVRLFKVESPDNALWSYATRLDNEGLYNPVLPTGTLEQGRYSLRIACSSPDGSTSWLMDKSLAVIPGIVPGSLEPIQFTSVNTNAELCVNGKPFPMVFYFHVPQDLASWSELRRTYGANTAQVCGYNSVDLLCQNVDTAWKAGLYSMVVLFHPAMFDAKGKRWKDAELIETVNRLKGHPGVLGYDLYDEADAAGIPTNEMERAEALVRKLDPKHVVWANMTAPATWKSYARFGDFLSFDFYPLPSGGLDVLRNLSRRLRAASPQSKPLLVVQQTWAMPSYGVAALPTPQQLRASVYMSICDDMKLFAYYSWSDGAPSLSLMCDPELRSATRLINWEIQRLTPFLFETRKLAVDATTPPEAKFVTLAKETKEGMILIAVNYGEQPIPAVTLAIANHKIKAAERLFDGRPVRIDNGCLIEDFPAFSAETYRVVPVGGSWMRRLVGKTEKSAEQ